LARSNPKNITDKLFPLSIFPIPSNQGEKMNEKITAYVIGHIAVKDAEKWLQYRSQVPATLVPWGADLVCRGKRLHILSGEHHHTDMVVIRFPDADSVSNWFNSRAYQALIPLRNQAAEVVLVSYAYAA
jgi:uncharacterized protein (DUF1330 family)